MFKPNTLFYSDGYKVGHKRMLAKKTSKLYGTWIPRSLKHANKLIKKIMSFGQQLTMRWLHDEFTENFFNIPLEETMLFGKDMSLYLGIPYDASHFESLHKLGYLPIKIKSLPEGIETNPNIPHMTFINTVDGFSWLTLYLETIISSLSWRSSTTATTALQFRRNAKEWVIKTDPSNAWLIDFMCHDFSARGLDPFSMLSVGLGHASSHKGSDNLLVIPAARYFYGEPKDTVPVFSVNASEHSVSTTKIFTVGEVQMILDWLIEFPEGILSIVADTFDLWLLITNHLVKLKKMIMKRGIWKNIDGTTYTPIVEYDKDWNEVASYFVDSNSEQYADDLIIGNKYITHTEGKLVIRPDSGNPCDIICGLPEFDKTNHYQWEGVKEPEKKGVIELLWDVFGGIVNEQGFKLLDPHIGAIYGDSINLDRQVEIYQRLAAKQFASTNIVLGCGSFVYGYVSRDTQGFAAKGAWFEADGKGYDIYKDPITDDGSKKSLKGKVAVLVDDNGEYYVKTQCTDEEENSGLLQVIYEDGKLFNQTTLQEIRDRISKLN